MKKILVILILILSVCVYGQDIKGYGIGFKSFGQANEDIKVVISDSEDEIFIGYDHNRCHFDWFNCFVPFTEMEKDKNSTGNGIIDFPLRSVTVKPTDTRTFFGKTKIDDVHYISLNEDQIDSKFLDLGVYNLKINLKTDKPGNLFYFNETPKGKIVLTNNLLPIVKAKITLSFLDEKGEKFSEDIVLDYNSKENKIIELPKKKGYCEIAYKSLFENGAIKEGSLSYGLIPDNRKISLGKKSPFGINTHFNHGKPDYFGGIVKRLGISWIRDSETSPYSSAAYDVAKKYGLNWFLTFSWAAYPTMNYMDEEIKKGKTPHDFIDISSSWEMIEESVKKYSDIVDYYDIFNEPDVNGWCRYGGDWLGGDWVDLYVNWCKQITKMIKKYDPTAKVVWEDMHLLTYKDMIKYGADNTCDYISPHTYSFHRVNPLPEDQPWFDRYDELNKILKDNNLNWKIIVGEVGTSDFIIREDDNHMYTPTDPRLSASILVRTYVMHLTHGVEKIFWFKLEDSFPNKYDCEGNFGIVNIEGSPKPAACAYANMINILEGAKFTGREKIDYSVKDQVIPQKPDRTKILGYPQYMPKDESEDNTPRFYSFTDRNNKKGYVVWVPEGSGIFTFNVGSKKVKIIDLYGNAKEEKTDNGKVTMTLDEYPVYIYSK